MKDRTILSLYDRSGSWSEPYLEAGYTVIRVDLQNEEDPSRLCLDCRLIPDIGPVHGILAAPPCTVFARSGARWPRSEADMLQGLSCVDAVLRLVWVLKPKFWALENPIGKLRHYLGQPLLYFDPCDYGDAYTKRTCLWGSFNADIPRRPVTPDQTKQRIWNLPVTNRANLRSITPPGFARAFFLANP